MGHSAGLLLPSLPCDPHISRRIQVSTARSNRHCRALNMGTPLLHRESITGEYREVSVERKAMALGQVHAVMEDKHWHRKQRRALRMHHGPAVYGRTGLSGGSNRPSNPHRPGQRRHRQAHPRQQQRTSWRSARIAAGTSAALGQPSTLSSRQGQRHPQE